MLEESLCTSELTHTGIGHCYSVRHLAFRVVVCRRPGDGAAFLGAAHRVSALGAVGQHPRASRAGCLPGFPAASEQGSHQIDRSCDGPGAWRREALSRARPGRAHQLRLLVSEPSCFTLGRSLCSTDTRPSHALKQGRGKVAMEEARSPAAGLLFLCADAVVTTVAQRVGRCSCIVNVAVIKHGMVLFSA